jgi:hypothetical protein
MIFWRQCGIWQAPQQRATTFKNHHSEYSKGRNTKQRYSFSKVHCLNNPFRELWMNTDFPEFDISESTVKHPCTNCKTNHPKYTQANKSGIWSQVYATGSWIFLMTSKAHKLKDIKELTNNLTHPTLLRIFNFFRT